MSTISPQARQELVTARSAIGRIRRRLRGRSPDLHGARARHRAAGPGAVRREGPGGARRGRRQGVATLVALDEIGVRSYVSGPERGRRCWQDKKTGETSAEKRAAQHALYGNRRRIRGNRGRRLQRRRGELVERPFAHQYETGGLRRVWVRGHENVRKRVLIQAAGCNLGLLLRRLTGSARPGACRGGLFRPFWA